MIERFIGAPETVSARPLVGAGVLASSAMLMGTGGTLLGMYCRAVPRVVHTVVRAGMARRDELPCAAPSPGELTECDLVTEVLEPRRWPLAMAPMRLRR